MSTSYSIVEARNNFATLVRDAETTKLPINVTRRGESVAVILAKDEYERLVQSAPQQTLYDAIMAWREKWDIDNSEAENDDWWDVRDKTPAPTKSMFD